jgi:hypothetical protein
VKSKLLALGALVIVALVVGLILLMHEPKKVVRTEFHRPEQPSLGAPVVEEREPIARPEYSNPASAPGVSIKRVNGIPGGSMIVHDHTSDADAGEPRVISTLTVSTIRQAVHDGVQQCGDGLRKMDHPPTARLGVHALVRIWHGRARVETVRVDNAKQLPQDVRDCISRVFAKMDADVPDGQPDGEETIHMPFNIP